MKNNKNIYSEDFFIKGPFRDIKKILKYWEENRPDIKWFDDFSHNYNLTDYIKYFDSSDEKITIIEYRNNGNTIRRHINLYDYEEIKKEYSSSDFLSELDCNETESKYPFRMGEKYYAVEFNGDIECRRFEVVPCIFEEKARDIYFINRKSAFKRIEDAERICSYLNSIDSFDPNKFIYPNGTYVMCSDDGVSWVLGTIKKHEEDRYYAYVNNRYNDEYENKSVDFKYIIPFKYFIPNNVRYSLFYNINNF